MSAVKTLHVPTLRFPEFNKPWQVGRVDSFVKRINNPVAVEPDCMYRQIGVRSHGKGIFHKEPVSGKSLGDKRVFWVHPQAFVVNIVFGWEQAVALTSPAEEGFIASHRFPMFVPVENKADLNFLLLFFLRKRGKYLLEQASPGGAGRNKTLGQNEFAKLDVTFPAFPEQQKIAAFTGAVDEKLEALRRMHNLLQTYKHGLMRKIFSQELRFKRGDGAEFPEWKKKRLKEVFSERSEKGSECLELLSVTVKDGIIKRAEIRGKDNSSSDKSTYKSVFPDDIAYNSMRMWQGAFGVSQYNGIVSPAYTVVTTRTDDIPEFFAYYFKLKKILHIFERFSQGLTSDTWNLKYPAFSKIKLLIPCAEEQKRITDFLSVIDAKIDAVASQIEKMKSFKKGLLQQMFV